MATSVAVAQSGWIRSPRFDLVFLLGVSALAVGLGALAWIVPRSFMWVVWIDVWFISYPHVGSTFTRIASDARSIREHSVLLFVLPPIVFALTAGFTVIGGIIALNTLYFYWQAYHYTKQSYGIARAYQRSTHSKPNTRDWLTDTVVFAIPIWGVAHRACQNQRVFFGEPLWSPPVPSAIVVAAGIFAIATLAAWTVREIRRAMRPHYDGTGHALFVLSHTAIFVLGYVYISEITQGWLVANIWHNAQYFLFVWAFNARRFKEGVDPAHRAISWLSQPTRAVQYALVCFVVSIACYFALSIVSEYVIAGSYSMILVAYQAVNFHHYIVDATIWKSRRNGVISARIS